jgi:4-hydroxythreonine-4-phosphate dehydrogenase
MTATNARPVIAISMGDPAGIGPEVALQACADDRVRARCAPVILGNRELLQRIARRLRLPLTSPIVEIAVAGFRPSAVQPGRIQASCGAAAAAYVDAGIAGCLDGRFAALVTCPINKAALHAAGVPFPGHTELLAARCGVSGEAMMMYHRHLAVVLATSHQSLRSVPGALTSERIVAVGRLFAQALARLRRQTVRIGVCGLNPHAGEGGLFGDEDSRLVAPAVARLSALGIAVDGPLPPDTAFTPANRARYDGYVCLYHDQGLIPFKALAFDEGVNVTLGLPMVRTSVDHGTAFDIAWQGVADHTSMVSALLLAVRLAAHRRSGHGGATAVDAGTAEVAPRGARAAAPRTRRASTARSATVRAGRARRG